jgi:hypothetical protein
MNLWTSNIFKYKYHEEIKSHGGKNQESIYSWLWHWKQSGCLNVQLPRRGGLVYSLANLDTVEKEKTTDSELPVHNQMPQLAWIRGSSKIYPTGVSSGITVYSPILFLARSHSSKELLTELMLWVSPRQLGSCELRSARRRSLLDNMHSYVKRKWTFLYSTFFTYVNFKVQVQIWASYGDEY